LVGVFGLLLVVLTTVLPETFGEPQPQTLADMKELARKTTPIFKIRKDPASKV
jgi:hypothetical protein